MNILFLLKTLEVGGVEVVTASLANKFIEKGYNVSIFAREFRKTNLSSRLSSKIHLYYGVGDNDCKKNVELLHDAYVKENVQIVVNQWGLPYKPIRLARMAEQDHHVKIISFHHSNPATNGKLNSINLKLKNCSNSIIKILLELQKSFVYFVTSHSMRYTYKHSDRFMVLSNSYLKELQKFIKVPPEKKQRVLTNPVTIEKKDYVFSKSTKQKKIIFCGRIDNVKCPQRVLEVWEILSLKFSDWSLSFIGDGPDKDMLTYESQKRGLKNVSFEGFQNPVNYYKTASILVMTSDFEGFPLVLAECMSFGVIPCVYDSFPALHDILKDNYNGLIVEKEHESFSAKKMSNKLTELMISNDKLNNFALNAIESSKRYSMDFICKQWEHELNELI